MTNLVTERTREIGVRMALGAAPRLVPVMVLGSAASLVAVGLGIGVIGALALTRSPREPAVRRNPRGRNDHGVGAGDADGRRVTPPVLILISVSYKHLPISFSSHRSARGILHAGAR